MNASTSFRLAIAVCVIIPILLLILFVCFYKIVTLQQAQHQAQFDSLAAVGSRLATSLDSVRCQVSLAPYVLLPTDTVRVAGTTIVLTDLYVRSQTQRELGFLLDHRWALVEAWQNMGRYDSLMHSYFTRDGIDPALGRTYVSENYLRARGMSPKGAEGPCGITEPTGRMLKLAITPYVDERRAPVRAFDAASRHLKGSYHEFHDLLLSVAGFNRGDGGVNERLYDQGAKRFFDILLPDETQRYVYRFLAVLLIEQQTDRFVPGLRQVAQLPPFSVESRRVTLKRTTKLTELAAHVGLTPTKFWFYNMQFRGKSLPPGTYTVYVPRS